MRSSNVLKVTLQSIAWPLSNLRVLSAIPLHHERPSVTGAEVIEWAFIPQNFQRLVVNSLSFEHCFRSLDLALSARARYSFDVFKSDLAISFTFQRITPL
jgi:hypothetical protein